MFFAWIMPEKHRIINVKIKRFITYTIIINLVQKVAQTYKTIIYGNGVLNKKKRATREGRSLLLVAILS